MFGCLCMLLWVLTSATLVAALLLQQQTATQTDSALHQYETYQAFQSQHRRSHAAFQRPWQHSAIPATSPGHPQNRSVELTPALASQLRYKKCTMQDRQVLVLLLPGPSWRNGQSAPAMPLCCYSQPASATPVPVAPSASQRPSFASDLPHLQRSVRG